jgi:hypothetical protein
MRNLLGEDVQLRVALENAGTDEFRFSHGGDYRGTGYPTRFKVRALDAAGKLLPDPNPDPRDLGGFGGSPNLKPGERHEFTLPLLRYRRFDAPGAYRLEITHDFGWAATPERPLPVAAAEIYFAIPTEAEAAKMVADEADLLARNHSQRSQGSPEWAVRHDAEKRFACMRYPVFLVPLTRLAQREVREAIAGIEQIESAAGVAEMVKLLEHSNRQVVLRSAEGLLRLVPFKDSPGEFSAWEKASRAEVQDRAAKAWDAAQFGPATRSAGLKMLQWKEEKAVQTGAQLVARTGEKADGATLMAHLDRQLALMQNRPGTGENVLDPTGAITHLLRAAQALDVKVEKAESAAEILYAMQALAKDAAERGAAWRELVKAALGHQVPLLREIALTKVPVPIAEQFREAVMMGFKDPDVAVRRRACEVVQRAGDRRFREQVLATLATARENWLFRAASAAALAAGARFEACELWVERLEERDSLFGALSLLGNALVKVETGGASGNSNGTDPELRERKERWKKFLTAQEREIRAGKMFAIGEAALDPALFGEAFQFSLKSGGKWPPIPEAQ